LEKAGINFRCKFVRVMGLWKIYQLLISSEIPGPHELAPLLSFRVEKEQGREPEVSRPTRYASS